MCISCSGPSPVQVTLLGVSPDTVRRLADQGVLRAVRYTPTSHRRFVVEDLERLLEESIGRLE